MLDFTHSRGRSRMVATTTECMAFNRHLRPRRAIPGRIARRRNQRVALLLRFPGGVRRRRLQCHGNLHLVSGRLRCLSMRQRLRLPACELLKSDGLHPDLGAAIVREPELRRRLLDLPELLPVPERCLRRRVLRSGATECRVRLRSRRARGSCDRCPLNPDDDCGAP